MINYDVNPTHIRVRWKKRVLGKILRENGGWVYWPISTSGGCKTDPFKTLDEVKHYLTHGTLAVKIMNKGEHHGL